MSNGARLLNSNIEPVENIYNDLDARMIYDQLEAQMDAWREQGKGRQALLAMARLLQTEMTRYDKPKEVPHAGAMEIVMRAVAADIWGDRSPYVTQKLTHGVKCWLGYYVPRDYYARITAVPDRSLKDAKEIVF